MKAVEDDAKYAMAMSEAANKSEGIHQATQNLNHQMARLIAQNSRLAEVLITTRQDETNKMGEDAAAKNRTAEELKYLGQRESAIRERQRKFVNE